MNLLLFFTSFLLNTVGTLPVTKLMLLMKTNYRGIQYVNAFSLMMLKNLEE